MLSYMRAVMRDAKDRGASAVEYGLMVAAIAAVIVGIVFGLGSLVSNVFNDTCSSISTAGVTKTGTATSCHDQTRQAPPANG